MIWPQLQTIAQSGVSRVANSLPEGVLITLFAAGLLRVLPRQNSGTRFAVWFVALLSMAALPFAGWSVLGNLRETSLQFVGATRPLVSLPESWAVVLFLTWLMAAFVGILRLALGLRSLRALRSSCTTIDSKELDQAIRQELADFSSSRSVALNTSHRIHVPAAMGFFKPVIVLPTWVLRELSPSELKVVLLHEFAHLRRGDAWTNLVQKIVRVVLPFHPAVWWIDGRLSLEREMACDDQVLAETKNPLGYAQCLIALLEKSAARRGWVMAQAAVHRVGEASRRIVQILDVTRPNGNRLWTPALGLVALFSLLCVAVMPRFVAFDAGAQPVGKGNVTAMAYPLEMPMSALISAAMHTGTSAAGEEMQCQIPAQNVRHVPKHRTPARAFIERVGSGHDEMSSLPPTNVTMKQKHAAASETLLIIRTAQQVGPNIWVWRVGVWRVNVVNPTVNGSEAVPVAKKT